MFLVSETVILRLSQRNYDCYCDYFILTVFNCVRFMLKLGCPGGLMSLYGPTFQVTPVDLCVIFQCNIYFLVEIKLFQNTANAWRCTVAPSGRYVQTAKKIVIYLTRFSTYIRLIFLSINAFVTQHHLRFRKKYILLFLC